MNKVKGRLVLILTTFGSLLSYGKTYFLDEDTASRVLEKGLGEEVAVNTIIIKGQKVEVEGEVDAIIDGVKTIKPKDAEILKFNPAKPTAIKPTSFEVVPTITEAVEEEKPKEEKQKAKPTK